ncbi:Sorting nexin mvp1 [Exophiala oligosperma]
MSLFGSSPTETAPLNSKSLFGDEPAQPTLTSSLFADDGGGGGESPWSMPTPKRNARQNLVKHLLPATDVPDTYVDAYDAVLHASERTGVGISLTAIKSIVQSSNLSEQEQHKILNFVIPGGQESANGVGRSEFNVLLALIGLGQEGEDITLDGVDERRRKLPEPKVGYIEQLRADSRPQPSSLPASKPTPVRQQKPRQESFGNDPTADPWASPSNRRGPPASTAAQTMAANGVPESVKGASNGLERTTSAFTTQGEQSGSNGGSPNDTAAPSAGAGWNNYNGSSAGFSEQPVLGGGFGDEGDDQSNGPGHRHRPSASQSIVLPSGTGESVTISMLPEKEGMFLFQHRNYEVTTTRRGATVVRRYSDFVWLLDCLQKRYPFRRLPLLPPKRVQVNGTHLSADAAVFLEKRRRGLVRFTNALVEHPILSQETLVVMFLTVPTVQELAVWRKQATISVQEEFTGKILPPTLEDSLPDSLPQLFEEVRMGVKRSAEVYINICILLERMVKRNEGLAAENAKFSTALSHLTEATAPTYAIDTNDIPLLNEGISSTSKHLSTHSTLLDDEAKAWDMGVLEDMKAIRDSYVSMRDMFDRRDRYARDNIPQLERRIEASEHKLQQLRQKPQGQVKPGEMEKVESSIMSDKESIVQQHARGVFIKECVRDEIVTFQTSIYAISRLHQDWSQERVKYAELQASNWRSLVDQLESMPLPE